MIDEALFTLLKTDSGVGALVAEASSPIRYRIFPLVIPQHESTDLTAYPCIVFTKVGATRGVTLSGTDTLVNATYQVDSYATTYQAAAQMADAVRTALVDYNGTVGGHQIKTANIQNELAITDPDPGLYRLMQTYSIWYVE
jgi:hypothetical protein